MSWMPGSWVPRPNASAGSVDTCGTGLPPLVRPFVYFCYRYVLRLGFLDGVPGITFHFLQALWYPMLIDIKYLELRALERQSPEHTHDRDTRHREA